MGQYGRYSKYNATKVSVDGHLFASKREAERYEELKKLEQEGKIAQLELQPRFELVPAFRCQGEAVRKMEYVADFKYLDFERGGLVVEDVKGFRTQEYKLKCKLFKYFYVRDGQMIFEEVQ